MKSSPKKAFSLAEALMAILILGIVSIGFTSSIVFMVQQTKSNRKHLDAIRVAEYFQNLALASNYADLNNSSVSSSRDAYIIKHHKAANPLIYKTDPTFPDRSNEYKVYFEVTGFGKVSEATEFTINADLPDGEPEWIDDEWVGNYLTITRGPAKGEIVRIVSNTEDTITVTADLSGENIDNGFRITPTDVSEFVINNGRTIRIFVTWDEGDDYKMLTRSVLLPSQGS